MTSSSSSPLPSPAAAPILNEIFVYFPSTSTGLSSFTNASTAISLNVVLIPSSYPSRNRRCLSFARSSASGPSIFFSSVKSVKIYLESNSRASILLGALYPWHTTKISADVFLLAAGLVASTFLYSCFSAYISAE